MMRRGTHILLVSWWFPPRSGGGVYRPLNFTRELVRAGHRVTVLTGRVGRSEPQDASLAERIPAGVRVLRSPHLDPFKLYGFLREFLGNRSAEEGRAPVASPAENSVPSPPGFKDLVSESLMLPDRWQSWVLPSALQAAVALAGDEPDVLFSTSPPHSTQLLARGLQALFNCPWVADFRDPWVANPFRGFTVPRLLEVDAALERGVIEAADRIITNTPALERDFRRRYPDLDHFHTITNGFAAEQFTPAEAGAKPRVPDSAQPLRIVHLGHLYGLRTGRPLLRGLARLKRDDADLFARVQVRLIGAIDDREGFLAEREERGVTEALECPGSLPHEEALRVQREADVLLILGVEDPRPEIQVPGKLYEYFAAGRPVLTCSRRGGAIEEVLRMAQVPFEQAEPDDPADIAAALARMVRRFENQEPWPAGVRVEQFRYDRLAEQLMSCFDQVLARIVHEHCD